MDRPRPPLFGVPLDRLEAQRLAEVFKALADPARIRLLSLIHAFDGAARVDELVAEMGLAQSTVSHHLRMMAEAGLLEREKEGVCVYYRVAQDEFAMVVRLLRPRRRLPKMRAAVGREPSARLRRVRTRTPR